MLAYRSFKLDLAGILRSPYADYMWTRGENRAGCQQVQTTGRATLAVAKRRTTPLDQPCTDPPDPTCLCGFYAYPTLRKALEAMSIDGNSSCVGLVRLYGRVIIHDDGVLRAQYCDVLALVLVRVLDPSAAYGFGWISPKVINLPAEALQRACALMEVPGTVVQHAHEAQAWFVPYEVGSNDTLACDALGEDDSENS